MDTGWGGWVIWDEQGEQRRVGAELWGKRFFLGAYPVPGAAGLFLGGRTELCVRGSAAFLTHVYEHAAQVPGEFLRAANLLMSEPRPYFWPLEDVRAPRWVHQQVVLLGDAAAGFLPTAGIGAGMALESAWLLGSALEKHGAYDLGTILQVFEATAKPRVVAAHNNSRLLAKLMFRRASSWAMLRDTLAKGASGQMLLGPIRQIIASRPDMSSQLRSYHS